MTSEIQQIHIKNNKNIQLFIKREDLLHPYISGNKYRKLKYNLKEARLLGKNTLLTFGGAYSNHIAATAYAGKVNGFKTIGVIRGNELHDKISANPTLKFAQENGMKFHFVSREEYRNKDSQEFLSRLINKFGDFYTIAEGGTNALAVKGCEEIMNAADFKFDYICTAVGTGGTIAGIINASKKHQTVLGFSALKGDFLRSEILKFANHEHWQLISEYHFGGYAKINEELITFINDFKLKYNVLLDPIYTGKMLYGVMDMIRLEKFRDNSKILVIHTGGLQGVEGMNKKLKSKSLPLINN